MSNSKDIKSKTKLIEEAGKLFSEQGFDGTSVRDICEKAEINISSISYYFGDKISIYKACFLSAVENSKKAYLEPLISEDMSFYETVYLIIKHSLLSTSGKKIKKWNRKLVLKEIFFPSGIVARTISESIFDDFTPLKKFIGSHAPNLSDIQLSICVNNLVSSILLYASSDKLLKELSGFSYLDEKSADTLAKNLSVMFVGGINSMNAADSKENGSQNFA